MRVERSAKRNANLAWVRHFDSRIARQIVRMNEPYEATLYSRCKFQPRSAWKPVLLSILANGGAYRDRTDDPLLAKQMLSQLS